MKMRKNEMRVLLNNERNMEFDIAKCIAIYLVVCGHVISHITSTQIISINYTHMPVFYFIGGYFLFNSIKKYDFSVICINKIKALLIPYLSWSLISFGANLLILYVKKKGNIQNVFDEFNNIFIYSRSVWFFINIFISMIILIFVYYLSLKIHINFIFLSIVTWLLFSIFIPNSFFMLYKSKWLFPFLLLGYLFAQNGIKKILYNKYAIILIILSFIISINFQYRSNYFDKYSQFQYSSIIDILYGLLYYTTSAMGIFTVFFLSTMLKKYWIGRCMSHIGKYTSDIYAIHMFLIKFIPMIYLGFCKGYSWLTYSYALLYSLLILLLIYWISMRYLRSFKIYRIIIGMDK